MRKEAVQFSDKGFENLEGLTNNIRFVCFL